MPSKQRRLSLLALLFGGWIAAGCSQESSPPAPAEKSAASKTGAASPRTKKKIVFVFKVGGISYSEACKAGAEQANADSALNAEVEYQASVEGTAEKQADIVRQAIVGKADAIVISPVDAKAISPAIEEAALKGVRVFTWDSDAPQSKREFYVAAVDDVQIGVQIGNALAKSVGEKGKMLLFSGQRTAANLNLHLQGVETALKRYPGISLQQPYLYNDDLKDRATSMAVQALQANPDAVGIACVNSPSPPAAGEALRKLQRVGRVKVWGLALPSETKAYLLDGSVTGLYLWNPQRLTYETAKLVRSALDGKPPQEGASIEGGKISVKNGIVTLPLGLEINKANVESLKF